jgi:hypothetical protein
MSRHDQHDQIFALRQLYGERANRNPAVRAALLELLLPYEATDGKVTLDLLEQAGDEERVVLLAWLANNPTTFDAELLRPIERLTRSAPRPEIRAGALAVLTRMRHPPTIEFAAKALRSRDTVEIEQGMRSALTIGGARMRLAIEGHLRDCEDPILEAAMLRAWAAPPSPELIEHCVALATDRSQPFVLRTAAATALAHSDAARASPLLRDLLRSATDIDDLRQLSRAIVAQSATVPAISRLLPDPPDVALHPAHWRALLAAGHPGAFRRLLEVLASPTATTRELRIGLEAWREPMVTGRLPSAARDLPEALRSVLMPPLP